MPKFIYRWHKTLPSFYFCLPFLSPVFPQFILLFVLVCLCWLTAAAVSGISDGFLSAFGSECLQTHSLIKQQVILKEAGFDRKRDTNCIRGGKTCAFKFFCASVFVCTYVHKYDCKQAAAEAKNRAVIQPVTHQLLRLYAFFSLKKPNFFLNKQIRSCRFLMHAQQEIVSCETEKVVLYIHVLAHF